MFRSVEAIVEPGDRVQLKESLKVDSPKKAILTLLDEEPTEIVKKKKPAFKWAGALAHLKNQYTSVELQHQALKWMSGEE